MQYNTPFFSSFPPLFHLHYSIHNGGRDDNVFCHSLSLSLQMTTNSSTDAPKVVHHYLFKQWPDHGVPATSTSILSLYETIKMWLELPPPVLIHCRWVSFQSHDSHTTYCSAGVGVTGVMITIITGIDQGMKERGVNVVGVVNKLRSQRMNMVQTEVK